MSKSKTIHFEYHINHSIMCTYILYCKNLLYNNIISWYTVYKIIWIERMHFKNNIIQKYAGNTWANISITQLYYVNVNRLGRSATIWLYQHPCIQ